MVSACCSPRFRLGANSSYCAFSTLVESPTVSSCRGFSSVDSRSSRESLVAEFPELGSSACFG